MDAIFTFISKLFAKSPNFNRPGAAGAVLQTPLSFID